MIQQLVSPLRAILGKTSLDVCASFKRMTPTGFKHDFQKLKMRDMLSGSYPIIWSILYSKPNEDLGQVGLDRLRGPCTDCILFGGTKSERLCVRRLRAVTACKDSEGFIVEANGKRQAARLAASGEQFLTCSANLL